MAESAGLYCPLCGEAAGLMDRSCRRCGDSLRVLGEGRAPAEGANVPSPRRERSWSRRGISVGFSAAGIVIAIMVLGAACAIIGVVVGD
jgi:hypothetical protein